MSEVFWTFNTCVILSTLCRIPLLHRLSPSNQYLHRLQRFWKMKYSHAICLSSLAYPIICGPYWVHLWVFAIWRIVCLPYNKQGLLATVAYHGCHLAALVVWPYFGHDAHFFVTDLWKDWYTVPDQELVLKHSEHVRSLNLTSLTILLKVEYSGLL